MLLANFSKLSKKLNFEPWVEKSNEPFNIENLFRQRVFTDNSRLMFF